VERSLGCHGEESLVGVVIQPNAVSGATMTYDSWVLSSRAQHDLDGVIDNRHAIDLRPSTSSTFDLRLTTRLAC
jgi:hypothetical protein